MNRLIVGFHNLKLVKKLWLSFAFVALVTLITFALLSSTFIRNMIVQREGGMIQQRIETYAGSLDSYLKSIEKASQLLIYSPVVQERLMSNMNLLSGEERIRAYTEVFTQIRQMWDNVYNISGIYLVDRYQNVFDTNVSMAMAPSYLTSENFVKQGWYDLAQKSGGAPYWSFVKWKGNEMSVLLFKAIYNKTDLSLLGYLVVAVSPQIFDTFLASSNISEGVSSVVDTNGNAYTTGGNDSGIAKQIDTRRLPGDKGYITYDYEGASYMVAYTKYPLTNWVFLNAVKTDVLLKDLGRVNMLWILFSGLSLLIMLIVSTMIARTISMPIRKMVKLIRDVERGNLMAKFQAQYKDEFGFLGVAYNNMIDKIREGVPLLREKFIRSLLERNMDAQELKDYERKLDFRFTHSRFQVALLYMHGSPPEQAVSEAEALLLKLEPEPGSAMPGNLELGRTVLSASLSANQYCLIFNGPTDMAIETLDALLSRLRELGLNAYAFVGNAYDDMNFVKTSYEEAKTLMKYTVRDRMDDDVTVYRTGAAQETQYPESFENRLVFYIDEGDYAQCEVVMQELMEFAKANRLAPHIMTTFLAAMYHYVYKQSMKYGSLGDTTAHDWFRNLDARLAAEPLERNCRDFLRLLAEHFEAAPSRHKAKSTNVIRSIEMILSRYHDPELSVDYMARQLGLTANYFSQLFKKEVGVGFVEYVGTVRLEEAKRQLSDTNDKVKEVAGSVGFLDPHYFGIWFKENTGLSPSQYRKRTWIHQQEA